MINKNLTNKWLNYPWQLGQGLDDFIHPDDIDKLKGQGLGLVLCLEDGDGEYIKVKNNTFTVNVRRLGVKNIFPSPTYFWGQEVKIISKPTLHCSINDLFWHHKDEKYYYQLIIGQKADKKRYSEDDIAPVHVKSYDTEAQKQLDQIYALIEINDQNPFNRTFDDSIFELVDDFLASCEDTDYIKLILDASTNININKIGCLLTIMLWSTRDEGETIHAWRVASFENGNQRDVQIALCVTDVYPMKDLNAFLNKLNEIKKKYPETESLCEHWMISTQDTLLRMERNKNNGMFQEVKKRIGKFLNKYNNPQNPHRLFCLVLLPATRACLLLS